MCLRVMKNAYVMVAQEDIVCYKVMLKSKDDGSLYSLYRHAPYKEKELTFADLGEVERNFFGICEIHAGLHSFRFCCDAEKYCSDGRIYVTSGLDRDKRCSTVIYKATIPKGAAYFKGIFDNHTSYVSNILILEELVKAT